MRGVWTGNSRKRRGIVRLARNVPAGPGKGEGNGNETKSTTVRKGLQTRIKQATVLRNLDNDIPHHISFFKNNLLPLLLVTHSTLLP